MRTRFLRPVFLAVCLAAVSPAQAETVRDFPQARGQTAAGPLYAANRPPLTPSPFAKLPIGAIIPKGWLRLQLELEAGGLTGRLEEISPWCKFEGNAWASTQGTGHSGWEELPYWLKGYGDLGYALHDEKIIKEARRWIDAVLSSQEPDGWFGPRSLKTSLSGQPDLWPHMIMLNVLQSFYEYSGDERVLPFLTRYFQWLNRQPPRIFGNGYWPKVRGGDDIESIYWLYNRTGEPFLLELSRKVHENMQDWTTGVHNQHNVNIAQGFREPGVYFEQARDPKFLQAAENNYRAVMGTYGQFPGGGFAGDENYRPGRTDPRQGFETCGIVEFMHSFEMLTKISGDPAWSDRCEDLAFNSLPAALTPDEKGLHYLTCANAVQLDSKNHAPGVQNQGTMLSYSPFEVYRCCQHNVSHGWPYFAEELWLATADHGLCASLYAPSEVTAKVADGSTVTISEETGYPFDETIIFRIACSGPARFPLLFRIPAWCDGPTIKLNARKVALKSTPLSYAALDRLWNNGDTVTLRLPMRPRIRTWEKNHRAVSVEYGPLTFSLKIGEKWSRYGGTDAWPEYEVFPTTPWNYALVLARRARRKFPSSPRSAFVRAVFEPDSGDPALNLRVERQPGPLVGNPFTQENVPLSIKARARRIPNWTLDRDGLVAELRDSPVLTDQPIETVTLIPMGAARLRITSFPVADHGPAAHPWAAAQVPPVSASHCFESDSVEAMIDGIEPKSSNDHDIPRFTWWDHRGTQEWVQWVFPKPRSVSAVKVYWFDDAPGGGCRVPQSWKVLYRDGSDWREVAGATPATAARDAYNLVSFSPVKTGALRLEVQLQPGFSGGILEWKTE